MTENRSKILNSLGYFSSTPLSAILATTGLPYGTVRGNLRDMRKLGIVHHENGAWRRDSNH